MTSNIPVAEAFDSRTSFFEKNASVFTIFRYTSLEGASNEKKWRARFDEMNKKTEWTKLEFDGIGDLRIQCVVFTELWWSLNGYEDALFIVFSALYCCSVRLLVFRNHDK